MDVTATILALVVTDKIVFGKVIAQIFVLTGFVSHNAAFTADVLLKDRNQGFCLKIINNHAASLPGIAVD